MGSDWLPFGILRRPHGGKGEILLHPYNGAAGRSEDLGLLPRVRVAGAGKARELLVAASRPVPGGYLVRFEGIADRESVAALVGQEVHLPRRCLAPLGAAEFYVEDLAGCEVFHPDGRRLGRVGGAFWNGAQDIMAVVAEDGSERLFPVVAEYVLRFDGERRLLVVEPHD
jgi:16S rRNA processing protein RimM